jgi:hypothetical protein
MQLSQLVSLEASKGWEGLWSRQLRVFDTGTDRSWIRIKTKILGW